MSMASSSFAADTAIQEFLPAGLAIKKPFLAGADNGYWERPVIVTHQKKRATADLRVHGNAFLHVCLRGEIGGVLAVLSELTAEYNVVSLGPRRVVSAQPHRTSRPR